MLFIVAVLTSPAVAEEESRQQWNASIVKIYSEDEVDRLMADGVEILRRRGDILLCLFPESVDGIRERYGMAPDNSSTKGIGKHLPRFDSRATPTLDKAVVFFGASDILTGESFDRAYTGKGVVAGICDIGIDPLHPAFLDEEGHSRIRCITQYIEHENLRIQLEGDDEYAAWTTDNPEEYHATHVSGIFAGRGAGSPYSGIAGDADIVVSVSTLTDVGLLAGVEDIIDYSKEVGKPCVINLSMGNYNGAHDGSSLFSQYLDLCADDAVIVLSAGNEGNQTNCIRHIFSAQKPTLQFRLGSRDWTQSHLYGMTDIWSGDDSPLEVGISIYDDQTKQIVYEYEPVCLSGFDCKTFTWESEVDSDWTIDGYLSVYGGVDPENGRYQAAVVYQYDSYEFVENAPWARYLVCVTVKGQEGNDVEVYSDGSHTRLMGMSGSPAPDSSMSFSDLACGRRVVSAGMYGNRSESPYTDLSSQTPVVEYKSTGYEPGVVSVHSSYATLSDGRIMPLTVAPGAPLVSAMSRPFLEANPDYTCLRLDSPWISMSGTSMSAPYVSGYIATFLEANPALTTEDILYYISETNVTDLPDPDNPRHGRGWFDPKTIMRRIIADAGVCLPSDPVSLLSPEDSVTLLSADGCVLFSGPYASLPPVNQGIQILLTPFGPVKFLSGR